MRPGFLAAVLLLLTALQGPGFAFAESLGGSRDLGATSHCNGSMPPGGKHCESCCGHGAMPSCATQCVVPSSAALPPTLPSSIRIAVRGVVVPDLGVAPFADHALTHPLRPPIL